MKQLLLKVRANSPLTDDELEAAIVHLTSLANLLSLHSPFYDITLNDVRKELQMLEMIYDLRIADRLKIKG